MKIIDELKHLDKYHGLKNLARKRIIPCNIIWYMEMYLEFDAYKQLGYKSDEAVFLVCEKMKVNERTVYRAKKIMEQDNGPSK